MTLPPASNRKSPMTSRATINVSNLRLRTFIGFNPDEKSKKQDVVINLEITYRIRPEVFADSVEDVLNYRTITKQVIRCVEQGRFLLLEKLVADVLTICSRHEDVLEARVTADKPHALRFSDSVSVTLSYRAEADHNLRLLEKAS